MSYLRDYLKPTAWDDKALTGFLKDKDYSFPDFLDIYFDELLSGNYKYNPRLPSMRFSNRSSANVSTRKALDWPTGMINTSRDLTKEEEKIPFHRCKKPVVLSAKNATHVINDELQTEITCANTMSAAGAAYYHAKFDPDDLPSRIAINSKFTFLGNASTAPPNSTPKVLTSRADVHAIMASRTPHDRVHFVSKRQGRQQLTIGTIDHVRNPHKINEMQFYIRDPYFATNYGHYAVVSNTTTITGFWDDVDHDGHNNARDNCPGTYNPMQIDWNNDKRGDACSDSDNDGIYDSKDNCRTIVNRYQMDNDNDGAGNVCDNCVDVANWRQLDENSNGIGDACEVDLEIEGFTRRDGKFFIELINNGDVKIKRWWSYDLKVQGSITSVIGNHHFRRPVDMNAPMYRIVPVADRNRLELKPKQVERFEVLKGFLEPGHVNRLQLGIDSSNKITETDEGNNSYQVP